MRNISWCPCLNTRLNLHISVNCAERAIVPVLILNVFRWKPLSSIYSGTDNDYDHWSLVLSLGNMDSNEVVMDNAILYSVYDSGQWLGYRFDSNPNVGWISGGKEHFDLMVISSHFLNL